MAFYIGFNKKYPFCFYADFVYFCHKWIWRLRNKSFRSSEENLIKMDEIHRGSYFRLSISKNKSVEPGSKRGIFSLKVDHVCSIFHGYC